MSLTKIRGSTQILDLSIGNAQIANSAGIELQKIQDGLLLVKSDGSVPFTAPIAGVAPTLGSHLTTKDYVDSVATGLDVKLSVRAISTANITLSAPQTIDGISLIAGDRVLVTGQTTAADNGIYVVNASAWTRATDADSNAEVTSGMFTFVEEGTTYGGSGWVLTTANPIVVGTTDLTFAQFSQAGVVQAGAGLIKTGTIIDVVSGNAAITVNPNDITLTLADSTLAITGAGLKLASLAQAKLLIGDATGTAQAQALSGDATITAAGVLTIANNAITNVKIADGTIALNKLVSATAGQLIVVNGSGVPAYATLSGDATVSSTGVLTLTTNSVDTSNIIDANVTLAKIETLASAHIIIGTTATGNQSVAVSGDATISEAGVVAVNPATVVRVTDVITRETPSGAINGSNTAFTLANTPKSGTESVFFNGLLMDAGGANDYTISGATITFTFAPLTGDKIRVNYLK